MKKKTVKIMSLVLAIALVCAVFAGCGKTNEGKNEKGQTVISIGGWPDKEGTALDTVNARKTAFEKANPDVEVVPDYWKFDRKSFYAKAAGGQLPMVYNAGVTEIPEIMESGYSADLTEILKERGYDGKFNPEILEIISKDGKIYAFPYACNVMGLMFNADLYKAAGLIDENGMPMQPETWDDVLEYAKKIKAATGKAGFVIPTASNSGGWLFSCLAWSFGVDFMEKDADGKWQATFNTPEAAEALQFIKDMKWVHDVLPATSLIDAAEWQRTFGTGEAGMTFGAGDYPGRTVSKFGMNPDQIGMLAMVKGPKRHVTLLSGDVYCVNPEATPEQIDAALRWLETGFNYNVTDTIKETMTANHKLWTENNQIIGIKPMSVWNNDTDIVKYQRQLSDEYCNTNPNYVKHYNDFAMNCPAEIQPEEPVCCQELYQILDSCLQEVLTNKDADCAKVLEKANADFQANYLDNLSY